MHNSKMVLLVIDTQKLIMNNQLYNFALFTQNIAKLISAARENNVEVIYVRHDDGEGEALTKGKKGFEIADEFTPLSVEKIFDKTVNSAFKESGLLEYLIEKGIEKVIITGLQTDYCIDASVKCAFEHGFEVIIPANANTTEDNSYMSGEKTYRYYNEMMWDGRYGKCEPLEDVIALMKEE